MTPQSARSILASPLRPLTALATAVGFALIVAGCSAGPLAPANGEPVDPEATSTEAAPEVVSVEDCVAGTWQVDNAAFEGYMNSLGTSVGGHMAVSGASYMRFDGEGTFSMWREDFTFTMTHDGQTIQFVSNSGEMGDYGLVLDWGAPPTTNFLWVAETMVVMTDEVMTVDGIATLTDQGGGGSTVEFFDGFRGEVPEVEGRESVEGSLPFTCDGDTMTFEFDAGQTMLYHRTSGD